jgi:hypothetical protein
LKKNGDHKMNFLNIDPMVLTQAIENAGWTKSVNINTDGSLEWYGESGYPTNLEIYTEIDKLIVGWSYIQAKARVAQYQLSVGVPESTQTITTGMQEWNEEAREMQDVIETFVIPAIEPLEATVEETTYDRETATSSTTTVANPVIVKDNEERAAAQAIIDATPGPVKAHVDG